MDINLEILKQNNFIISKEEKIQYVNIIYVDDINKRFAIKVGEKGRLKIYNYNDLGKYELIVDDETIIQGKGIATIIGGASFGIIGAIAGASGKRAKKNICSLMQIRILVNDLEEPEIVIPLISFKVKKGRLMYNVSLSEGKKLMSILSYIERNSI